MLDRQSAASTAISRVSTDAAGVGRADPVGATGAAACTGVAVAGAVAPGLTVGLVEAAGPAFAVTSGTFEGVDVELTVAAIGVVATSVMPLPVLVVLLAVDMVELVAPVELVTCKERAGLIEYSTRFDLKVLIQDAFGALSAPASPCPLHTFTTPKVHQRRQTAPSRTLEHASLVGGPTPIKVSLFVCSSLHTTGKAG